MRPTQERIKYIQGYHGRQTSVLDPPRLQATHLLGGISNGSLCQRDDLYPPPSQGAEDAETLKVSLRKETS